MLFCTRLEKYGQNGCKSEETEKLLYSLRCQNCTGRPVYVGTNSDLDPEECSSCGQIPDQETLEKYGRIFQKVYDLLEVDEEEKPMDTASYCLR